MTRRQGVVASAAGLIPFGHLGWGYHNRAEFLARAAEYIADGLAQNQWVEYVGAGDREQLRAELATMPGIAAGSDIEVTPAREFYALAAGSDIVDPHVALTARIAVVEKAIADGYTGYRIVSDATAVTHRPEQRDAFARFEFLIDQKMTALPGSALCAYDINELADAAAGLICLHPFVSAGAPTFRLYAEPGTGFALTGDIDAAGDETFTTALRRIWPLTEPGRLADEVVIDARRLEFISHRQLLTLDRCARTDGRRVVLRTGQRIPTRLVSLLGLANVVVQPTDDPDDSVENVA